MSKRNWGIVAALVGVALLAAFVVYGLAEQSRYNQEAQRRASDHAKHAAYKIEQPCVGVVSGREKAKCLRDAVAEYRLQADDNRRDYEDLIAQRTSAMWTSIMGIAALIGMALSAVGVALVWTTFREQKRATDLAHKEADRARADAADSAKVAQAALATAEKNASAAAKHVKVAQDTASAQLRAYLSVRSVTIDRESFGDDADAIKLEVVNNGQTPGTITRLQVTVNWFPTKSGAVNFLKHESSFVRLPQRNACLRANEAC